MCKRRVPNSPKRRPQLNWDGIGFVAAWQFNENSHFGFEGACKCVFAEGPFYGDFQNMGPPSNFGIADNKLMDFVVKRQGSKFTISVSPRASNQLLFWLHWRIDGLRSRFMDCR